MRKEPVCIQLGKSHYLPRSYACGPVYLNTYRFEGLLNKDTSATTSIPSGAKGLGVYLPYQLDP